MSRLAARQSALGTVAQVLPKLWSVLGNLRPTWHLRSLEALTPEFLARHEITGIIWDIDGTLTVNHAGQLAQESRSAFQALATAPQLRQAILSNAGQSRFLELTRIFPSIPVHQGFDVDGVVMLRTRVGERDSWSEAELAQRLAGGATPLRKPHAELVRLVVTAMGAVPAEVVMVGDQYFTDIAGANLAGVRSIKVPTLGRAAFPAGVRMAQRAEGVLYRVLHGAPRWEGARARER